MPAINRTVTLSLSAPKPLLTQISRHPLTTTSPRSRDSQYHRSDFQTQGAGYTSSYEPDQPTRGPLAQASKHGAPRLTPTLLKEHLDKFVVGQDRAKRVVSVAIFNHYQRTREVRRQEAEEQSRREQQARWELRERERRSHPVENEYPGHVESVDLNNLSSPPRDSEPEPDLGSVPLSDSLSPYTPIEKSNLMLLGPSGVGKTYILQTLATVLEVPFASVDCSSLTQAGYIGSDIESAIERLLLASDHSATRCETGIIFFDEVDKLAKPAVMTHGRDVSGEGVQQGLLKMIEGTTVTVTAKSDRSSKSEGRASDRLERGGGREGGAGSAGSKSEQYTIDTRNILFVFAGAFIGLDKIISARLSRGSSIGFGAKLRDSSSSPSRQASLLSRQLMNQIPPNPLESLQQSDLQTYGLIPELLGRIPILTALDPLSLPQLVSILTEPRNSLVRQYTTLLQTSNIQLKFTTGALHAIAARALYGPKAPLPRRRRSRGDYRSSDRIQAGGRAAAQEPNPSQTQQDHSSPPSPFFSKTSNSKPEPTPEEDEDQEPEANPLGARGLRSILESVLFSLMFKGPGSAIRYALIDEAFVLEQTQPATATATAAPPQTQPLTRTNYTSRPQNFSARPQSASEQSQQVSAHSQVHADQSQSQKQSQSQSQNYTDHGAATDNALPRCWSRGQGRAWEEAWEREEEAWKRWVEGRDGGDDDGFDGEGDHGKGDGEGEKLRSFQSFRRIGSSGM